MKPTSSGQDRDIDVPKWEERFKRLCLVNKDGDCKYWNPETFGYAPDYMKCSMDKFFPEKIKDFIAQELATQRQSLVEEIKENAEEVKKDYQTKFMEAFCKEQGRQTGSNAYLDSGVKAKYILNWFEFALETLTDSLSTPKPSVEEGGQE